MKQTILVVAASLMLVACGGSPESKFAKNCGATMEAEGMTAEQATATCKCAYAKLETELDGSQLKLAAEVITAPGEAELEAIGGDTEAVSFVFERTQGAVKSCAI